MDAIAEWTGLLRPDHELTPIFCTSLAYAMRSRGVALGLATLCISGGQGLAVVLERV